MAFKKMIPKFSDSKGQSIWQREARSTGRPSESMINSNLQMCIHEAEIWNVLMFG